jgi:protein translocase SecG subunit
MNKTTQLLTLGVTLVASLAVHGVLCLALGATGFSAALTALAALLAIGVIILQNPKGGGLSSTFGGAQAANQLLGGASQSADVLETITWGLIIVVFSGCLMLGAAN